jgi:hypothetical protein
MASGGKPMNVADQFVVGVVEIGEWHKQRARSKVLETENMNQNQQQDSTMFDTNSTN